MSVDTGEWKAVSTSRGGPVISHCFFVDDLLLMGEATLRQAETMEEKLQGFYAKSSQRVSSSKSRIWYSPNTKAPLISFIGRKVGMQRTRELGVPIHHKRVKMADYGYLISRVRNRMKNWKWKHLLRGANMLLINMVTSTLPLYVMQTTCLHICYFSFFFSIVFS